MSERPVTQYCKAPDGISLAYQVFGDGGPNLLWSPNDALPIDTLMEEPGFLHLVKRLGHFSRAAFCDGRGMGASGGDPLARYDANIVTADLGTFLDALGFDRAVLIGYSGGGPAVIRFSAMYPDRVSALVLISSFAHYLQEPGYPVGYSPEKLERYITWLEEQWGTGVVMGLAPSKSEDSVFRDRISRSERLGRRPDQAAELSRRGFGQDVRDLLAAVSAPTLVIHRTADPYIRVEAGRYLSAHIPGSRYVELAGEDHYPGTGDVDALVDEIEEFVTGTRQAPEGDVVMASILFTDIVSSTEQSAALGHRKWTKLVDDHDAMVRSTLTRYRGREIKTTGDGFLATFDATTRAVRAAMDIVKLAGAMGIEVRAGVHVGEVEVRPDDVVGLAVSIAKRVCDLAGAGKVFVSESVRPLIADTGIATVDEGVHALKGVPRERRLYSVQG